MNYENHYNLAKDQINMIMGGLMVGLLVAAFDYSIMATAMPQVINSLHGMEYYVWPFTSYMLSSTIAIILFGKLSDIYGRKHILIAGIITFVITSVMCGFATNMFELIIFRGLQGIGGGILISLPFIVVGEIFSPREQGQIYGNTWISIWACRRFGTNSWRCNYRYFRLEMGVFCKCSSWDRCCNHDSLFSSKL